MGSGAGRLAFSEVLPVNVTNAMSEEAVEQQRVEYTGIFGKEAADALIDQEAIARLRGGHPRRVLGQGNAPRRAAGPHPCDTSQSTLTLPVQDGVGALAPDDRHGHLVLPGLPRILHLDIVDYYEAATVMGFDHYCEWLDDRGYRWPPTGMPHDAKVREVGAPGARTRIETLFSAGPQARPAGSRAVTDGRHQRRP